jgi:hypothetical protein
VKERTTDTENIEYQSRTIASLSEVVDANEPTKRQKTQSAAAGVQTWGNPPPDTYQWLPNYQGLELARPGATRTTAAAP